MTARALVERVHALSLTLAALAASAALVAVLGAAAGCRPATPDPGPPAWQILASELPAALLSVSARSASDVYAVGADKGTGPLVLHFDGKKWASLPTGHTGDLWWVQALPSGPVLLSGASGTVLRFDGTRFERLPTPALAKQTVYGVWGTSGDDFYAVGSAAGRAGFVWHHHDGAFEVERIPLNVPRTASGEVPGFFKVWGHGDEVWVVGAAGTVMHRQGTAPFTVVPSGTKDTLFTVSGAGDRVVAVGGAGNGFVFAGSVAHGMQNESPAGAGLLQGISVSDDGDWASGERGAIYSQAKGAHEFSPVEHGLVIAPALSLHAIARDPDGGVWTVGGDVLTPALNQGMLLHLDPPAASERGRVPTVTLDDDDDERTSGADASAEIARASDAGRALTCPASVVAAGKDRSIARRWNEQALAAIRLDLPRPTVHARNLFHLSAATWDAYRAYGDDRSGAVFVNQRFAGTPDPDAARRTAISYASYRLLAHRYATSPGAAMTAACLRAVMLDLGYDPDDAHETAGGREDAIAFGNHLAHLVIAATAHDGANEANDCNDPTEYRAENAPLVYDAAGATLRSPDKWQPLNLSVAATQNGIILPAGVQAYIGSHWGEVTPFALRRASASVPWVAPGPPPTLGPALTRDVVEVIAKTAAVDPNDPTVIDVSPGAYGNNPLGTNDGKGWPKNPVTGAAYPPQVVPRRDFARVMAEFWADGPQSETPPGHWNVLANAVADSPSFARRLFGKGAPMDPLAWDVHLYLAINGALHDAAIAAWDIKRRYTTVRPISLVRWMGAKGQSSDPQQASYDPGGLPLVPGLIELVTTQSSAPGQRHEGLAHYVGEVAVRDWLGEPGDRDHQVSGVGWVRAVDWITYQRRTFVTPAFPAFISGHSTFSRAGAEVLASLTGSPYFPGGLGEFVAAKGAFLKFESGPSVEVRLQWASYFDAADEAGQSRLWGSIHIGQDDLAGRRVGHRVGLGALALATRYFEGSASVALE